MFCVGGEKCYRHIVHIRPLDEEKPMPKPLEILASRFPEVAPLDYYRALFPAELMEERGTFESGRYNGIAIQLRDDGKARRVHVTRGLEQIGEMLGSGDFSMIAPVLFAGKQASLENARWLTALEFDLDFLRVDEGRTVGLEALFFYAGMTDYETHEAVRLPRPTYIVLSSERNLHVVYLLERPLAMYPNVVKQIRSCRKELIRRLWNGYITEEHENPQFEISPVQAFRLVGSKTKRGDERVRCFLTGEPLCIEELNRYLPDGSRITAKAYYSNLSLDRAKELYPDWYKRRIEESLPPHAWRAHRGLYDWWKSRIDEIKVGHRYYYLLCLASFALKCGIPEEELLEDMAHARKELDRLSPPDNKLTMSDMAKAAQAYQERYRTLTRETISRLCGIEIRASKRNGRTKSQHVTLLNAMNNAKRSLGEQIGGEKSRKQDVFIYFCNNPNAKVSQAAKELGVSRKTIYKWLYALIDEGKLETWPGANGTC